MPASGAFRGTPLSVLDFAPALNPVERFTSTLPYKVRCADRLSDGLAWAFRSVALLHDEIAPDPPGWTTSLRFDVDCVCDGRPHIHHGRCDRAATYWRDAGLPEPSFVVVNPANGHAHYVYLLRGWIRTDGADAGQMPAVRYLAAIARAYTLALRADPGYAGLMIHNPLSYRYTTIVGEAAPYTLRELAVHVTLAASPRRQAIEIRCEGRNVETFDRLRVWAYRAVGEWRCRAYADWAEVVAERALAFATSVRDGYSNTSHPFSNKEVLGIAKSVAGWVWLRYDAANPIVAAARAALRRTRDRERAAAARRALGCVTRDVYLEGVRRRRNIALRLHGLGVTIIEIARRLSAGIRTVYRWLSEVRSLPRPSALSDFKEGRWSERGAPIRHLVDCLLCDAQKLMVSSSGKGISESSPESRFDFVLSTYSAKRWRSPCDVAHTRIRKR